MKWLDQICRNPEMENLWLDLLSQMEFVGLRKIVKANPFSAITLQTLQHAAEEASHAFLLKGLVAETQTTGAKNPLSSLGWAYFQTLDQSASAHPEVKGREYPVVSRLVEERVLRLYPAYLAATSRADVGRVLRRILAQEKRHHDQFEGIALTDRAWSELRELEARLWEALETGIYSACERYGMPDMASFQALSRANCTSNQSDAGSRF